MNGTIAFHARLHIRLCLIMAALFVLWTTPATRADEKERAKVTANYLDGLDDLLAGKWADAVTSLGKAVDADEENPDYRTAHGVSLVMSEQFPAAIKELERSLRLRPDDWEAKLWLGAAYRMSGDAAKGANYIVHGPPHATKDDLDYSNFVYTMSQNYWSAATHGHVQDPKTGKALTTLDITQASFIKAASLFAQRRRAAAPRPLAGQLLDRVKANMQNRQFVAALNDLDSLLIASPENDDLLLFRAEAELALGDYCSSRNDYTRVLIDQPLIASAYLGRAQAAAHLADADRARQDLLIAQKYGAPGTDAAAAEVDRALAAFKLEKDIGAAQAALLEQARQKGPNPSKLTELALGLVQTTNAHRLRYDEIYQDHLRILNEALASDPKNSERLADLADYIFKESEVPFEQIEPRMEVVYYRYALPPGDIPKQYGHRQIAREVDRAEQYADAALASDANQVKSLSVKAAILNWRGKFQQARPLLEKALSIKADDPELLSLMAQTLEGMARENLAEAAGLRSIKAIESPHKADGTYTITTISPSPADLARAEALENAARQYRQTAAEDWSKCVKLTAGTARGFYYQGLIDLAASHTKEAKAAFEQAVKLDPKFRDAWDHLADVLQDMGLPEEWAAARSSGLNLVQTTAAPWLMVARDDILKTKFKSAREALASASRLDPADPRIEAYLVVIDSDDDKPDEALAHDRAAIALEEARALLHGKNLSSPAPLTLRVEDIGLTLALRNRAGALLFQAGQVDAACQQFQSNLLFLSAVSSEKMTTFIPEANLPNSTADNATKPPSETYASLKIRSQAGLDYTAWAKRYNDSKDTALAWQTYNRLVVQFQVTDPKPDVIQAVINLGLAELEVSKGNFTQARELLRNEGATPQPLWQEMRKVEQQIH